MRRSRLHAAVAQCPRRLLVALFELRHLRDRLLGRDDEPADFWVPGVLRELDDGFAQLIGIEFTVLECRARLDSPYAGLAACRDYAHN